MLIVLFIIFLILTIIGELMQQSYNYVVECLGVVFTALGGAIGFFIKIVILFLCLKVLESFVVDEKIKMYEVENKNIETQISEVVNQYQGYEKEVVKNIDKMSTILIKVPELKSNELVNKQIEIYIRNNDLIKQLKEDKINYSILKWWLYFK